MIAFLDIDNSSPYKIFKENYDYALSCNQDAIEAISISSYNATSCEVSSRYVNLKYIKNQEWIFFSNYNSKKNIDFLSHNQISGLFYWNKIDLQIRIKAKICKTSSKFSDEHFISRSNSKNALAISSNQSEKVSSYNQVQKKYLKTLNSLTKNNLIQRPHYWGGFSFTPYYFEFWNGHKDRINKRNVFELDGSNWKSYFLEP